jgi:cyclic-di-GMP-binding protein
MNTEFGMTHEISAKDLTERFHIPEQDLARLSFCQSTKAASVFDWIHGLPLTQIDQVSAIFYNALPELARVKASWELRLSILETVRTPLHQCMEGLSKRYLNQPLIMPEEAVKTATIAQALQKHLLNAYLVIVREIALNPKDKEHHLAIAIYRALVCINYLLMRSLQLYLPPPEQLWKTAHSLFLLAEYFDISEENCMDPLMAHIKQGTPMQAYSRLLLLAASRPNQLRQDEIQQVFSLLEANAQSVKIFPLESSDADNSLISLTLTEQPPLFLSKAKQLEINLDSAYQLNTDPIIQRLKELSQPAEEQDQKFTTSVIQHLQTAWKQQSQRSFPRQVTRLNIEVIVGLTNIHYYLAGELPFQVFLQQESSVGNDTSSPFAKRGVQLKSDETDPWDDPFDIKGNFSGKSTSSIEQKIRQQALEQYQGQHQTYSIPLIDKSPGGYGLEWQGDIPIQVKTGELIALKEQNRSNRVLGVIRWAHQIKGATQLGVQILSPKATPVGIALIHRTGGFTEYLRGLQLPELRAVNQPTSLITNAVTFHENSKVKLFAPDQEKLGLSSNIQLTKRLFSTGAFTQFGYRALINIPKEDESKL